MRRKYILIGGLLLILGLSIVAVDWPKTFNLIKSAYRDVEDWAKDRGEQIRIAFGIKKDTLRPEGTISPANISTNEWNAAKIDTLASPTRDRFRQFTAAAQKIARQNGQELMIWDAARSLERQLELYKRGRTTNDKIVTFTIASNHLFGNAADYYIRASNGFPDFERHPSWYTNQILPLAGKFGLESLFLKRNIDRPHIQVAENPSSVQQAIASIKSDFPDLA